MATRKKVSFHDEMTMRKTLDRATLDHATLQAGLLVPNMSPEAEELGTISRDY
jgi:hypothetical protein